MKAILPLQLHVKGWGVAACLLASLTTVLAQAPPPPPVQAEVHFDQKLRDWDGFGVNYVEVCGVRSLAEYKKSPEDYGGFSTLPEAKRQEILDMIFGEDGLKPALIKMFLDSLHEGMTEADRGKFDHETTTQWMRYFVREGLKRTRARGGDLQIITTMYGPPGWTTKQRIIRGRDLDPAMKEEAARYLIDWAKFLRQKENFPVKYLSLHNEGDSFNRWPADGSNAGILSHDYNMWWPPTQVVDFLRFMKPMMDKEGLTDVGITPGETTNWENFGRWYAYHIATDPAAMKNIGLITSHGFGYGPTAINSLGVDTLRLARPDLHAWDTSQTWSPDTRARAAANSAYGPNTFVEMVRQNIYDAKVNGIIPWAVIQSEAWGPDPANPANPHWHNWIGTVFFVDRKGGYKVDPGYYYFKQVSRAGQPGMGVAAASSTNNQVGLIAFAANGTRNADAFVLNNLDSVYQRVAIRVTGTKAQTFDAFITDPGSRQTFDPIGTVALRNGVLEYNIPAQSVVTFFAKQ